MPYKDKAIYKAYQKAYRKLHSEELNEGARKYYHANKPKLSASAKNRHLIRTYGLSFEELKQRIQGQNNSCALCGEPLPSLNSKRPPHIDHCHKTGKVRGIVHPECNAVLGFSKENPIVLQRAIEYIKKHESA